MQVLDISSAKSITFNAGMLFFLDGKKGDNLIFLFKMIVINFNDSLVLLLLFY